MSIRPAASGGRLWCVRDAKPAANPGIHSDNDTRRGITNHGLMAPPHRYVSGSLWRTS